MFSLTGSHSNSIVNYHCNGMKCPTQTWVVDIIMFAIKCLRCINKTANNILKKCAII